MSSSGPTQPPGIGLEGSPFRFALGGIVVYHHEWEASFEHDNTPALKLPHHRSSPSVCPTAPPSDSSSCSPASTGGASPSDKSDVSKAAPAGPPQPANRPPLPAAASAEVAERRRQNDGQRGGSRGKGWRASHLDAMGLPVLPGPPSPLRRTPYFDGQTENGKKLLIPRDALIFNSRFESGNLCMAVRSNRSPHHYTLVLRHDANQLQKSSQWFYFSVSLSPSTLDALESHHPSSVPLHQDYRGHRLPLPSPRVVPSTSSSPATTPRSVEDPMTYSFQIINFTKEDSLYQGGMRPYVYSTMEAHLRSCRSCKGGSSASRRSCPNQHSDNDGAKTIDNTFDVWSATAVDNVSYYQNEFPRNLDLVTSKRVTVNLPPTANGLAGLNSNLTGYYSTLEFTYTFQHPHDTVYFAHCYPYTYTYLRSVIANIRERPEFQKMCSIQTLCKSEAGFSCPLITITNPQPPQPPRQPTDSQSNDPPDCPLTAPEDTQEGDVVDPGSLTSRVVDECVVDGGSKDAIVISSRVHPGESNSSWILHGLLRFLLSDKKEAVLLRNEYLFKIVPMLNVDGVVYGHYRTSLTGDDWNRVWQAPQPGRHSAVYHLKGLLRKYHQRAAAASRPALSSNAPPAAPVAPSGPGVLVYCDFHGHSKKKDVFMYANSANQSIFPSTSKTPSPSRPPTPPPPPAATSGDRSPQAASSGPSTPPPPSRLTVRLLPDLMANRCPVFSIANCTFRIEKQKEGSGRVVVGQQLNIPCSYTLEASLYGSVRDWEGRETSDSLLQHFSVDDLQRIGCDFGYALYDFMMRSKGEGQQSGAVTPQPPQMVRTQDATRPSESSSPKESSNSDNAAGAAGPSDSSSSASQGPPCPSLATRHAHPYFLSPAPTQPHWRAANGVSAHLLLAAREDSRPRKTALSLLRRAGTDDLNGASEARKQPGVSPALARVLAANAKIEDTRKTSPRVGIEDRLAPIRSLDEVSSGDSPKQRSGLMQLTRRAVNEGPVPPDGFSFETPVRPKENLRRGNGLSASRPKWTSVKSDELPSATGLSTTSGTKRPPSSGGPPYRFRPRQLGKLAAGPSILLDLQRDKSMASDDDVLMTGDLLDSPRGRKQHSSLRWGRLQMKAAKRQGGAAGRREEGGITAQYGADTMSSRRRHHYGREESSPSCGYRGEQHAQRSYSLNDRRKRSTQDGGESFSRTLGRKGNSLGFAGQVLMHG
ncbi:unnamed protein product [Vitrella brassicaformis CCMP3155]|uniref:Peptidase M14 domain-containing protein n=3 Tax=Vitrella brassicaformis TaxID=1169539 RepID=A0A0G4EMN4_VITBC|nr:unnamed protein product [Vitrella brassicaformis CCMP3155]|eukprot:CEL98957.1 unnamed protein product [Vitrella brassicaformis CCMP3155]